ncbi:hypothetical protein CQW23_25476 [Capsicum baccatum]|uniref:Ubiquitin-like protease family profile domain-containing protein n=1 Tax=Capsicum baccatum TaxID=33114 RepID=A0A2G2VL15_CAPBA|nr:hypothetical protein CQW23_25476 [Capsicum baccatum]
MYQCGGFPLAFQYWFYEYCPYADNKLAVRVEDSVLQILKWSVTIRPNYRKVKFAFSDINREQFAILNEYHSGHNVGLKNDDTRGGNPIEVNLSNNVEWQTDGTPKIDHISDNVVDGAGDCDRIDVVARDHLSDNVVDDIGKEIISVYDYIDTGATDRPITENVQCMKDLVENNQEIDWSVVLNSEISKYTQPDKIGEHSVIKKVVGKIDTNLGCTSVALEATEVLVDVGSIRKNVDDTSIGDKSTVILDDTPIVPRRIRKPVAICESPYVSKFDSSCSNIQGQPTKCVAEKVVSAYSELIPYLLSSIDFGDKRSDGISTADSFDIRMVDGLPTQKNTDCGIFVVAFAEYMIECVQFSAI